jgi:hypothetical protein
LISPFFFRVIDCEGIEVDISIQLLVHFSKMDINDRVILCLCNSLHHSVNDIVGTVNIIISVAPLAALLAGRACMVTECGHGGVIASHGSHSIDESCD